MKKPNLSIIGLGKLGSPMVAAYASKGYKVIGVDTNHEFVKLINEGKPPVREPKLTEYLDGNKERISATKDYKEAILNSDITFIIVPTPSREDGEFSTKYAVEAGKEIGKALKEKFGYHLVVLTSTLTPGYTEKDLLPALEEYSGKKCTVDFDLCYNPEFIALGNVIQGLLYPDFVLIGESSNKGGEILESFYNDICEEKPPIKRMSIVNAEITKISLNTYVTTKISYANMISELCEKIPGGNIDVVTDALGCDKRIGSKYLKGGLGYGGPCFPRDNRALMQAAKRFDFSLPIAEATDKINKNQIPRVINLILSVLSPKEKVAILGLSYKPDTGVVEESQGVEIADVLVKKGVTVMVYDPAAMENGKKVLGDSVLFCKSLKECVQKADIIFIATPWKDFLEIEVDWLRKPEGKKKIIDCWRILNFKKYKDVSEYFPLGINKL